MRFLWSLLCNICSVLKVAGIVRNFPDALFHKPKKRLPELYQETIFADKNFTESERKLILSALDNLHEFVNGSIRIVLEFTLDPTNPKMIVNNSVLFRVNSDHPAIRNSDGYTQTRTLGLCNYMSNDTCQIYLVMDRLNEPITFQSTALHELGHFIGMGHVDSPSIMSRFNSIRISKPTYNDAKELSRLLRIHHQNFRYLKL